MDILGKKKSSQESGGRRKEKMMKVMDVMDDETARSVVRLDENCMYVLAARHRFSNIEEFRQKVSARPDSYHCTTLRCMASHCVASHRTAPRYGMVHYATVLCSTPQLTGDSLTGDR